MRPVRRRHLWDDRASRDEKAILTDQPTPQPDSRGGYGALLRRREFTLFFVATSVSTLGTSMIPVALTFALLTSGYTVTTVGAVFAAETLPAVVLLLVGGMVGDRWPRRLVMTGADILRSFTGPALLVPPDPALPPLDWLAPRLQYAARTAQESALLKTVGEAGSDTADHRTSWPRASPGPAEWRRILAEQ
jgi:hypothetical protein